MHYEKLFFLFIKTNYETQMNVDGLPVGTHHDNTVNPKGPAAPNQNGAPLGLPVRSWPRPAHRAPPQTCCHSLII